jgi:hypothetical protein
VACSGPGPGSATRTYSLSFNHFIPTPSWSKSAGPALSVRGRPHAVPLLAGGWPPTLASGGMPGARPAAPAVLKAPSSTPSTCSKLHRARGAPRRTYSKPHRARHPRARSSIEHAAHVLEAPSSTRCAPGVRARSSIHHVGPVLKAPSSTRPGNPRRPETRTVPAATSGWRRRRRAAGTDVRRDGVMLEWLKL